jgi:uncharacterized glyoxalase superfamily protein PhnB
MPVKPIPDGFHTVTPYLTVTDASLLLDFLVAGLGAREQHIMRGQEGKVMHGDVLVGDSHVMFGQAPNPSDAMQAMLYLYVKDADAMYRQAIGAGATSISEMKTEFYGDRVGAVRDCCGNQWYFATHVEDVSNEELERRARAARRQS